LCQDIASSFLPCFRAAFPKTIIASGFRGSSCSATLAASSAIAYLSMAADLDPTLENICEKSGFILSMKARFSF
jgi:hypothetical protein